METTAKRAKRPVLSSVGEHVLAQYERRLCMEEDLKYREFPLKATVRVAFEGHDPLLTKPHAQDSTPLFRSEKRHTRLTEWGLGYLIKKYAEHAKFRDVSPHDLRYRMAACVSLHRRAQLMGHDSLDTTLVYVQATKQNLQQDSETVLART